MAFRMQASATGTDFTVDTVSGEAVSVVKLMLGGATNDDGYIEESNPLPISSQDQASATLASWSSDEALISSSGALLTGIVAYNSNDEISFVQIFDADSTGDVTLGTTSPLFSIPVPGGGAAEVQFTTPVIFSTGIVLGQTTTALGGTGPTSDLVVTTTHRSV